MIDKLTNDVITEINAILAFHNSGLAAEEKKLISHIIKKLADANLLSQEHFKEPFILVQLIKEYLILHTGFISK